MTYMMVLRSYTLLYKDIYTLVVNNQQFPSKPKNENLKLQLPGHNKKPTE